MPQSIDSRGDTVPPEKHDFAAQDIVWMGAPDAEGGRNPSSIRLFATQDRAEEYVESIQETSSGDPEWTSWDDAPREGRRLVTAGTSIGVVGSLRTTVSEATPPFTDSMFERLIPSDSRIRSRIPVVHDRPAVDRDALPFMFLDAVLFSERGHLELQVDSTTEARYLDELERYAEKTGAAGTATSDDRVARSRIEELEGYIRVEDTTAFYGKPRYRLAKRLSEWGGKTGRYAALELWLLYQLVLRLYPNRVSWEANYGYHDDH